MQPAPRRATLDDERMAALPDTRPPPVRPAAPRGRPPRARPRRRSAGHPHTAPAQPHIGLTTAQAERELARVGRNVLAKPPPPHWAVRFARNLTHLFALLLWAGAALAVLGGQLPLAVAIVAVILVNAVFSFAQEFRAERAVEALGRILPHRVHVRRDGHPHETDAEELVPGDVLLLAAGDRVPADATLLVDVELHLDLSTLTGESRPVRRHAGATPGSEAGLEAADRVFAGTHVVGGVGEALVTATGMATELGRIAQMTQATGRHQSPLEREMDRVTRLVAVLSVSIGTLFFLLAGALGMGVTERFVFAIGVIVANVPEGLLPTVTLSLALATQRMARRNAIVRRLSAVEALGCTTVICTDKTGTLTANEMTVRSVWTPHGELDVTGTGYAPDGEVVLRRGVLVDEALEELARAVALCNDAALEDDGGHWTVIGDPTEGALLTFARKAGVDPAAEVRRHPRRGELPFGSDRKRMSTLHVTPKGLVAYVKGAPAVVLPRTALPAAERAQAQAAADELARQGLRVLAVGRRDPCPPSARSDAMERELELLGLVAMHDPPRPEVPEAIGRCLAAGMRVLMVTGDHGLTAEAIARRIGLVRGAATIVDGTQIDRLDDRELVAALGGPDVLVSRVTPEQKLRIALALRAAGEVVAMTGDGVNDAPALRAADIGVAMGAGGTDVAREAADVVLLDDNFASIAAAVEEGRAVYDNIRRFAEYHFSSNVAELLCFLAWGLSGGAIPLPLVVMQVLAIDLGTDLLPAIALGTERPEPGVMERPPRARSERLLNRRVLARVYGFVGLIVGFAGLASFFTGFLLAGYAPWEALPDEGELYVQATAMTYAGIVFGQVGASFAFRTSRQSVVAVGLLSNRLLLCGVAFELALLAAMLHVSPLQDAFHMEPLDPRAWPLLAAWPVLVLGAEEARKALLRRRDAAAGAARDA
ncbi:MAG TPA: cation-transporting P-type ATPase [Baekduia sp.]|nr:cation-transporting P-type ATPase [Baekduia sp.]